MSEFRLARAIRVALSGLATMNAPSGFTFGAAPPPAPPPPSAPVTGAYRTSRTQLFTDIIASTPTTGSDVSQFSALARDSVASPKNHYQLGNCGPSAVYVEQAAKWTWTNVGGDWINTAGTAQATTLPHVSFTANAVTSGSNSYSGINILPAVTASIARGKWLAVILMATGAGFRRVISRHHATLPPPSISVTYADGSTGTLACVVCVRLTTGTATTLIGSDVATLGTVAVEFEMPTKMVTLATLNITLDQHTTSLCTVNGYLANPPVSTSLVTSGLASSYPADVGITANPAVLFAQRYVDGTVKSDYIIPGSVNPNVFQKSSYDPSLWGGTADLTKLPTAWAGTPIAGTHKWFYKNLWDTPNISIVASNYTGNNFQAVAPGIGAMKIVIPAADSGIADGGNVGYSGSGGSDLWMLFPKSIIGLVNEVFVRFKFRIASQPELLTNTRMFRTETGAAADYGVASGKFGIGAMHWTPFGGNDNAGGGDLGWSARMKYVEHPLDVPNMMGYTVGVHAYDQLAYDFYAGKQGLGAGFEPDRWYDIEIRLLLNTWAPTGGGPSDGVCQMWIDGKLDSTHTGWKFRDGPLDAVKTASTSFSPFREIGAIGLCLNSYNGGVKAPDHDVTVFYANVVAATERIGPMTAPAETMPSWAGSLVAGNWVQLP